MNESPFQRNLPRHPGSDSHIVRHYTTFVCRNPDGSVAWEERDIPNRLFNAGELLDLRADYRGESVLPVAFFGRLYNDTPADTDALSDLTGEPSSNGYQAIPWSRNTTDWGAAATVSGQGESLGLRKSFSATGAGWGPVTHFVMATTSDNSGSPWAYFTLSQPRTVLGGQSLDVQPRAVSRGVTS